MALATGMVPRARCRRIRSGPRLLDERGVVAQENRLDFLNVRHLGNRAALGQVAIALIFGKPLAQVCNLEVPLSDFPNLSLRQDWRPTVPSQFHNAVCH